MQTMNHKSNQDQHHDQEQKLTQITTQTTTRSSIQEKSRLLFYMILYTVSFWGIFYPNFSLTRDVCTREADQSEISDQLVEVSDGITIRELREGDVRYKSRLWEYIQKLFAA